jgi:hypothetical protein
MTSHGQRVIGVVTVIDIGDAKFDFEYRCRKGHVIVSTLVVFPEQSGRFECLAAHLDVPPPRFVLSVPVLLMTMTGERSRPPA